MASIFPAVSGGQPSGKWTAQVNLKGKRTSRTFATKRAAEKWARLEEADRETRGSATKDVRLMDVLTAYIEALEDGRGGAGKSKAASLRMIGERLGRRKLSQLDVDAFRTFARERMAEGAGPATIGMDFSFISTLLTNGTPLVAGADASMAMMALRSARKILSVTGVVGKPQERDRLPTEEELEKLFAFWDGRRRATPMKEIVLFAATTGMRLSEITRIRWDGFDPKARTIFIKDRKHPTMKAANSQTIPLLAGPFTFQGEVVDPVQLIEDRRRFRRGEAEIWPYDAATVSTGFTRGVASALGEDADLHFHDLRHLSLTNLFRCGLSIAEVSRVSGHRDWGSLKRYVQLSPDDVANRLAQLGRVASSS